MMKKQKIYDERLVIKNLKNLRTIYALQALGVIAILGYNYVTSGVEGIIENPLWIVFIGTMTVNAYLSMNISIDHENDKKSAKRFNYFTNCCSSD